MAKKRITISLCICLAAILLFGSVFAVLAIQNPQKQESAALTADAQAADTADTLAESETERESETDSESTEMRAVWIYYGEIENKAKSYDKWKKFIDKTFDTCVKNQMNTVILQVRPCADAIYPSRYYPWSAYLTGTAGKDPGFDPFAYAVSAAHERGLKIQAWVNPYRITLNSTDVSALPKGSVAKKWANSKKASERKNVLSVNGALYFNPSSAAVRQLVANGVKEIVENYDVDGIHMDDYFYPTLGKENKKKFDYKQYQNYARRCQNQGKTPKSLTKWRRSNVDKMVSLVYQTVKKKDPDCVFGISPAGNLESLYAKDAYYSDVKKWMKTPGYVDYICPQIYWSFSHKKAPYKKMVDEWVSLKRDESVKLYIGLAGYRAGISLAEAKSIADTGWAKHDDILKRQVVYARKSGEVDGFFIYSYSVFKNDAAKKEIKNLRSVFD